MSHRLHDLHDSFKTWGEAFTPEHLKIAYRANLTNHEMKQCHHISTHKQIQLSDVLQQMARFKESIEYRLYKRDFIHFF